MAKSNYSAYVAGRRKLHPLDHHREALTLGSDAPFFRDGKMNREPHSAPHGPAVVEPEAKHVHIHHYKDPN